GAVVRATTDGGDPRTAGMEGDPLVFALDGTTVVRAVVLLDGVPLGFPVAHTYLFPDQIPDQRAPEGAPSVWWTWSSAGHGGSSGAARRSPFASKVSVSSINASQAPQRWATW
ncbi:MAG: hypothetical protein ABIO70_06280, partial [Pseudomonadota bacterium]